MITSVSITKFITPIFDTICIEEAKRIGGTIVSEEANYILKNIEYRDFVLVEKDNENNLTMVKSNVVAINIISADIKSGIQKRLNDLEKQKILITFGSLLGNKLLAGLGPNINLKIVPIGSVDTEFTSEFIGSGINQTIHKLYLKIHCNIDILTPHKVVSTTIKGQILFAENIIVGEVPDAYYNLEGLRYEDILEVIN